MVANGMLMPLLFALAVQAPPTDTPDDCTLNVDALKGVLDTKSPRVQQHRGARVAAPERAFEEQAVIDGRSVRWRVGGCAHYSYTLSFTLLPADDDGARGAPLHATALRVLEALPIVNDEGARANLSWFREGLAAAGELRIKQRGASVREPFFCGEYNTCELSLAGDVVALSFDFPL